MIGFAGNVSIPIEYWGNGYIQGGPGPSSGIVRGTSGVRAIVLLYASDKPMQGAIDSQYSATDGSFRFDFLNTDRQFFIRAIDPNGVWPDAFAGPITPTT